MTAPQVASIFRHTAFQLFGILMLVSPVAALSLWLLGPESLNQQSLDQQSLNQQSLNQQLVVAALSAAVSIFALVPGMLLPPISERGTRKGQAGNRAGLFVIGCAAAMAIRAGCTVALVVVAGYHLGAIGAEAGATRYLSLSIGFWYVLATVVEIVLLARGGRQLDQSLDVPTEPTQSSGCKSRCQPPTRPPLVC